MPWWLGDASHEAAVWIRWTAPHRCLFMLFHLQERRSASKSISWQSKVSLWLVDMIRWYTLVQTELGKAWSRGRQTDQTWTSCSEKTPYCLLMWTSTLQNTETKKSNTCQTYTSLLRCRAASNGTTNAKLIHDELYTNLFTRRVTSDNCRCLQTVCTLWWA